MPNPISSKGGRPERKNFVRVIQDFSGGIENFFSPHLHTRTTLRYALNVCNGRDRGTIAKRLGSALYGTQITAEKTITGLHQFKPHNTSYWRQLATIDGATNAGKVYYYNSGWTLDDYQTITTAANVEFCTFINRVYAWSGGTPYSWDGNTSNNWLTGTSGNLGTAPEARYPIVYQNRQYALNTATNPNYGYYSELPTAATFDTWDQSSNFFQSLDGRPYTGVINSPRDDRILLFTEDHAYVGAYNTSRLTFEQYEVYDRGTTSHRSLVNFDNITFFFNKNGFFRYVAGEKPLIISQAIQKIIDGISPTYYTKISGDKLGNSIFWSVGDITISEEGESDLSVNNAVLRYDVYENAWWLYSFYEEVVIIKTLQNNNEDPKIYFGNNDGEIFEFEKEGTYSDNLLPFASEIETHWDYGDYANHPEVRKIYNDIFIETTRPGMNMQFRIDNGTYGESTNKARLPFFSKTLKERMSKYNLPPDTKGYRFKIRFSDNSVNNQPSIQYVILNYSLERDILSME